MTHASLETAPPMAGSARRDTLLGLIRLVRGRRGILALSILPGMLTHAGTLTIYFKTKDDVLQALRERFVANFHKRLEETVATCAEDDEVGQLNAWTEATSGMYLDEFALHDLMFHEFRPSHPQARNDNRVTAHLTLLIAEGAKAGAWTVRSPRQTAAMLFSAMGRSMTRSPPRPR